MGDQVLGVEENEDLREGDGAAERDPRQARARESVRHAADSRDYYLFHDSPSDPAPLVYSQHTR